MKTIFPDYYPDFKCIAEKCKNNCCIGWEIDIDGESLKHYQSVKGDFGERLKANISLNGTPHFILSANERCPFLNRQNLCDIFTSLGEDRLCDICKEHPRFYNELDDRIEAGLGLCCEEAARLIITKKEPQKLINEEENPEGFILLRKKIFEELQNRELSIPKRIENTCAVLEIEKPEFDILKWVKVFEGLERLDESWTKLLLALSENYESVNLSAFEDYIKDRETEYEQFLCYLIYRHALKAEFFEDFLLYFLFAVVSYELISSIGASVFAEKGSFTTADQLELMRIFSSEIEYSDENLDIILNELEKEIFGY